jgi:hypothetical protein
LVDVSDPRVVDRMTIADDDVQQRFLAGEVIHAVTEGAARR